MGDTKTIKTRFSTFILPPPAYILSPLLLLYPGYLSAGNPRRLG
jgi:hypothetical protein